MKPLPIGLKFLVLAKDLESTLLRHIPEKSRAIATNFSQLNN